MNWPLIIALLFAVGLIVGNILLLKQSAKIKMPTPKKPYAKWDDDDDEDKITTEASAKPHDVQKQNGPE